MAINNRMVKNMKDTTKKVVILNNFVSPYVSEAIIILKDYDPRLDTRAIADAEKIVSAYIEKLDTKKAKPKRRKKTRRLKIAAAFLITIVIIALCCYLQKGTL